jgi:hypothetical protein
VLNHPSKYWSDYAKWEITQFLHHVVLTTIKEIILASSFQSNSIDELIIADNQSWISMHYYVMASWKRVLILFTFERMVEGGTTINIKNVIMVVFIMCDGMANKEIVKWVVG